METATGEKTADAPVPAARPPSDTVRVALIGVLGGLIGALGTLLGTYITSSNEVANRVRDAEVKLAEVRSAAEGRARDADVRMVEIGVGVLRAKPDETGAKAARQWAIELVEKRSGVQFSEEAKAQLLERPIQSASFGLPSYVDSGVSYDGSFDSGPGGRSKVNRLPTQEGPPKP